MSPASRTVHLERVEHHRNMARFYTIAVEVTLFDAVACTRSFGRIGGRGGRVMIGLYGSEAEAIAAFRDLLGAKLKRGYAPTFRPPLSSATA